MHRCDHDDEHGKEEDDEGEDEDDVDKRDGAADEKDLIVPQLSKQCVDVDYPN